MLKTDTYSQLYPGRFVKSDELRGKKVTLTIKEVGLESLHGDKGAENKAILTFAESKKQYVAPKTVGYCIMKMFGKSLPDWVGKRVTFYPTTTRFGKETVDCIRVWGSPDIAQDMAFSIPQGRKKPLGATMHRVNVGECGWTAERASKAHYVAPVAETVQESEADTDELPETQPEVYDFGPFGDEA